VKDNQPIGSSAAEVVSIAHKSTERAEEALRDARNRLMYVSGLIAALAGILLFIQWRLSYPLVRDPQDFQVQPWQLLVIIFGAGLVGGLLTAISLLTQRSRNRYHLSPAKAVLRGAMGMVTGFHRCPIPRFWMDRRGFVHVYRHAYRRCARVRRGAGTSDEDP